MRLSQKCWSPWERHPRRWINGNITPRAGTNMNWETDRATVIPVCSAPTVPAAHHSDRLGKALSACITTSTQTAAPPIRVVFISCATVAAEPFARPPRHLLCGSGGTFKCYARGRALLVFQPRNPLSLPTMSMQTELGVSWPEASTWRARLMSWKFTLALDEDSVVDDG